MNANTTSDKGAECSVVELFEVSVETVLPLPLAFSALSAGFPSPALDFDEMKIDLNRELIRYPASTFFGRVRGESMRDAGIGDGDLIVIDKSINPVSGRVAVCIIDGEFTLKRLHIERDTVWLMPANEKYAPIQVTAANDFRIWGIVTYSIKAH